MKIKLYISALLMLMIIVSPMKSIGAEVPARTNDSSGFTVDKVINQMRDIAVYATKIDQAEAEHHFFQVLKEKKKVSIKVHITAPHNIVPVVAATTGSVNGYACGGQYPPCYVLQRESHGNPYAVNPGHQGAPYGDPGDPLTHASGLWQFMPRTWNNFGGYPYAAAAPASVQEEKAREVWTAGDCSAWNAC